MSHRMTTDTIAAISTPPGEGAIALVRLSGPRSIALAESVFHGRIPVSSLPPRQQSFGPLRDGDQTVDEVILILNRAPKSYTGEDVVEIACHGGLLVSQQVLRLFLDRGARLAHPGEFTERAFLNGKMDLTQAEAVMDLIHARTPLALRSAAEQLEGRLGQRILAARDEILSILAHVEAYIDFPEEDIDPETGTGLRTRIDALAKQTSDLLATAEEGKILREGLRLVLCGEPNVGKSSLLNLLLGYDRAIVSPTAGTTRDTIEEVINLRGIPVRLTDTAGMREAEDFLEQAAIYRTRKSLDQADLILQIVDGSQPMPPHFKLESNTHCRLVANKSDLATHPDWLPLHPVIMSSLTGEGQRELEDAILDSISHGNAPAGSVAINARHQAALKVALRALQSAGEGINSGVPPEIVALELRTALDSVGEIIGRVDTEDLLGVIFSQFCIGK